MRRQLCHGDNLDFLRAMPSESVNLVATDPPFNTGRDFRSGSGQFTDRWAWSEEHSQWLKEIHRASAKAAHAIGFARGAHSESMGAYLCWLGVRLLETRRVLTMEGSLYLHIDDTASAYVKVLLDTIFGPDNYRNTITWRRASSHNDPSNYGRITDCLLYYSKDASCTWNGSELNAPMSEEEVLSKYRHVDSRGRYRDTMLGGPSHGAKSGSPSTLPWRGYDILALNRVWAVPRTGNYAEYIEREFIPGFRSIESPHERLDALDDADLLHYAKNGGVPKLKTYADAFVGKPPQNLILDPSGFTNYNARARGYVGYPTQKPTELYEMLVKASSNPGDVVLDPFSGSGTTLVAAERLSRQWVGMDLWPEDSLKVVLNRLANEGVSIANVEYNRA